MFRYILKKMRLRQLQIQNQQSQKEDGKNEKNMQPKFNDDLEHNLSVLWGIVGTSNDIITRRFTFGNETKVELALIFIDGLADKTVINENIIKPLMSERHYAASDDDEADPVVHMKTALLSVGSVEQAVSVYQAVDGILSGNSVLLADGSREFLVISTRGWETRSIEEPKTESVVRGPHEGFTENLRTNTAMIRRKVKNPDFTMESLKLGTRTKTNISIAYIKGLADPKLIDEIRRRLGRINTDAILESGYIEQFIEDAPYSIFSTVANSEKPDKVAAKLMDGRVAVLVDGTPFVLTVPMVFIESFQSTEDYYSRTFFASMIRTLRFISYFISVLAPALYVALSTFHQELIPTPLLLTMAAAHEGIPFPSVLEAGLMITAFEILREAGVRLPRPIGQAVSIVGALVIGESAVSAGLIGAPMVIVVAITAVSSFVIPAQTDSGAMLRYMMLILAGFMGGYGIAIGLLAVFIHMASLRSFGTPYLSPLAPLSADGLKDVMVRLPLWSMIRRPRGIATDPQRQPFGQKPEPPRDEGNFPKE